MDPLPDALLEQITALVRGTRKLIEGSAKTVTFDGAATAVLMTAYVMTAKHHGVTKAQFMTAMSNVWDLNDKVTV
jgi:hypothetical protein